MRKKNFKKYLLQGTILTLFEYFSDGSIRTIKGLISGNFNFFIRRILYYHIGNLAWNMHIIIIIPSVGILCYSIDKLLAAVLKKEDLKSKNIQIYLKNMGLFLLKYTLVVIFFFLVFWGGIYIDRFLRKTYNLSYSYCFYIMLGFSILFNYLISWVIYSYKRKKL